MDHHSDPMRCTQTHSCVYGFLFAASLSGNPQTEIRKQSTKAQALENVSEEAEANQKRLA